MGLFLCIWMTLMFMIVFDPLPEEGGMNVKSGTVLALVFTIFFELLILNKHDYILTIDKKIETNRTDILSFKNSDISVNGSFVIGTGVISSTSQYSFFVKNPDGSKEKKFIPVRDTKIFEGDYTPHIEVSKCTSAEKYNFLAGWYQRTDDCEFSETRKIFVPMGTVILDFNVN